MLSIIMTSAIYDECDLWSVAYMPILLIVIMLNVVAPFERPFYIMF